MTEKTPRRFQRRVPDQGDHRRPGRPGALGPVHQVLDPRQARPPSRRRGEGQRRGPLFHRRPAARNALRPHPPLPLRGGDDQVHRPRPRPLDAGREGRHRPDRARRKGPFRGPGGRGDRGRYARARRRRPSRHRRPIRAEAVRRRHRGRGEAGRSPGLRRQGRDQGLGGRRRGARQGPRAKGQRRRPAGERQGRRRGRLQGIRRHRRSHLRHPGPGPFGAGAARTRRPVGRREPQRLGVHAGDLRRPRRTGRDPEDSGFPCPGRHRVHGRRVRRQVRPPSRGSRCGEAREGGRSAGQALPRPQGGADRRGQSPLLDPDDQGRRHQGREAEGPAPRRPRHRRDQRRHRHLGAGQEHLRLPEPEDRGVRRLHERRPLGRVPRSGTSPGRLRARSHDGRPRPQTRHGSRSSSA